jgi:hypothetical protein
MAMGRPKKHIDQDMFEKLCSIFCTKLEIADMFNVSEDTLENWCKKTYKDTFSAVYKSKSSAGKRSLRRKQFEVAMGGDRGMLIWLGKNYLGQSDKLDFVEDVGFEFTSDQI